MDSNETGIYKIVHSAKPDCCYIGSATRSFKSRWSIHVSHLKRGLHHSKYLQRVVDKYGIDGVQMVILELSSIPKKEMRLLEQKHINEFLSNNDRSKLFNTTLSTRCITDDPEIKERQRQAATKNGHSEGNLRRINEYNNNEELKQKRVAMLKKSLCIPVVCCETGKTFESFSAAKRWIIAQGLSKDKSGRSVGGIRSCCLEEQRTAYGYHWKFLDNPPQPEV